jgi:hypothetical protein
MEDGEPMTRHEYFNTRDSGYEAFLSAALWEEAGGAPLSVMSAFARLGLEPWVEADRLRALSRHSAASALAASLSRLPILGVELPDYASIAARLVKLLPEFATVKAERGPEQLVVARVKWWWLVAAAGVLVLLQMKGYLF